MPESLAIHTTTRPQSPSQIHRLYAEPTESDSLLNNKDIKTSGPFDLSTDSNDQNDNNDNGSIDTHINQQQSTGQAILSLAIPAAGALLIDPLLNLVDTALVGRTSQDALPLAGMGSATAILTLSFYLFNFLCTATTPLVGKARAAGRQDEAAVIASQALSLALALGVVLAAVLLAFQQPLLLAMGTSITGYEANMYAMQFLTVRALAAPAILTIEASTGILRGYLDTQTPIVILVAANVINLLLDILLVVMLGLGPLGAAVATTTAEWTSAGLFLAVLAGKIQISQRSLYTQQVTQTDGSAIAITPTRSIPSWEQIQPLITASSAVFVRAIVLQASLALAAAMAARGGAAAPSVAAHQIGIQLWLICSFFCDSLAAASQGLVADALGRQDSQRVQEVARTVLVYSAALGLGLAALLQAGDVTGGLYSLFTRDAATQQALSGILPLIVIAQPLNALVFAADGILQGALEFPFQAKAMVLSGLTAVSTFVFLQNGGDSLETLVHVWTALIVLQVVRGLTSLYKLVDKNGPIDLLSTKR
jgi:putative MATE family efflux protein